MPYELVTPSTLLPVTVDQAKDQLRITSSDEDLRIEAMIRRAARHVEEQAGIALGATTWRLHRDRFPKCAEPIAIRKPPITQITAVRYYDPAGDLQTLDPAAYDQDLISRPARIKPVDGTTWPETRRKLNAVQVEFTAGYATQQLVPLTAVQLILLLVERWMEPEQDGRSGRSADQAIQALMFDCKWAANA